jgi:tubulin polyglutamylase complex subunit 2
VSKIAYFFAWFTGEVLSIGNMKINSISELRRLAGIKSQGDADYPTLLDVEICSRQDDCNPARRRPNFGVKCKIFELDSCQGIGKVLLKNNKFIFSIT